MKRIGATFPLVLLYTAMASGADKPEVIELWPAGKVPGITAAKGPEAYKPNSKNLTEITVPSITVYKAPKESNTGTAIVVAPGGGYSNLAWEHEGTQVAEWLNSIGVTGIVLKYRVPVGAQPRDVASFAPHQDAQRAMGIVRSRAAEWGIAPNRIGMMGFSAGGNLTAMTITNYATRGYEAVDEADKASCRPDFAAIIYPGGVVAKGTDKMPDFMKVTKETPPAFLVHATDDKGDTINSIAIYLELKKNGVPAEMHLYAKGGHGFGMHTGPLPVNAWPKRCEEWMASMKLLKPWEAK